MVREGYTSTVGAVLPANSAADPYAYLDGANSTDDNGGAGYTYQYYSGVTDADLAAFGLVGGNHYVLEIDMSPITNLLAGGFTLEWTQECGNDKGTAAVPEPTTIAMAGAGLFGIVMGRRRMKKYVA